MRDLSEALPEMPMDPITGVGVVASRNRAPTGYDVVNYFTHLQLNNSTLMNEFIWNYISPKKLHCLDI